MKLSKIGAITGAVSGFVAALLIDKDYSLLTAIIVGMIIGSGIGLLGKK